MKKLPPIPCGRNQSKKHSIARHFCGVCLVFLGLVLVGTAFAVPFNHGPTISFIPSQVLKTKTQFAKVYFRAWDNETTLTKDSITPVVENQTPNFYSGVVRVAACTGTDTGCPQDGTGYKLTFDPVTGNGAATIKVTVSDGNGLDAATSFVLRRNSLATNPPVVAGIPDEEIQSIAGAGYGPVQFVAGDLDSVGNPDAVNSLGESQLTPTWSSDNTNLLPVTAINVASVPGMGGRTFVMTAFPNVSAVRDRAVVTVTLEDPDLFKTSVSFVLDVIPTNTPPSFVVNGIGGAGVTFVEQDVKHFTTATYSFQVTDTETMKQDLLVTAVSSNAVLVPNTTTNLSISPIASDGSGTLTLTPLALPSPSPGVPQASTITLTVADNAYNTSRLQFLYVAKDPTWAGLFSRPAGVYHLDPKENPRPDDADFLTGEMHRISWREIDNGGDPSTWDWTELNEAVMNLPENEFFSLNLIEEPCDIADGTNREFDTYCNSSAPKGQLENCDHGACGLNAVPRAVPWDDYLRSRRRTFLQQLANHVLPTGNTVAHEPKILIINPICPGAILAFASST